MTSRNFVSIIALVAALVFGLFGSLSTLKAQEPKPTNQQPELTEVFQLGGQPTHLDIEGDYTYLSVGDRLEVFANDLTVPTNLRPLSSVRFDSVLWGKAFDVSNGYAYVLADGGFKVFDIKDPVKPRQVGEIADYELGGHQVVAMDDYVYIAGSWKALAIIDVSNPVNPTHVYTHGHYVSPEIAVSPQYIFRPHLRYVEVLDLTNPVSPTLAYTVGQTENDHEIYGQVALSEDNKYLAVTVSENLEDRFRIFDISDLRNVQMLFESPNFERDEAIVVRIIGDEVVVLTYTRMLRYNLHNLNQPPTVIVHGRHNTNVLGHNGNLVVLDEYNGFFVVNQSNEVTGEYTVPVGSPNSVSCGPDRIDVASANGLWTLDTRSLTVQSHAPGPFLTFVAQDAKSNRTFTTDWYNNLYVFENGQMVDSLGLEGGPIVTDLKVHGDILAVAFDFDRIRLFNTTTLRQLSWMGSGGRQVEFSEDGTLLFVARGEAIVIYDLTNPRNPKFLGSAVDPNLGDVNGFVLLPGNRLFTVSEWWGRIFDLSDPTQPQVTDRSFGHFAVGDNVLDMVLMNDTVHIVSDWGRMYRVHTTNGSQSDVALKGNTDSEDGTPLCVQNGTLFVANYEAGLIGLQERYRIFLPTTPNND